MSKIVYRVTAAPEHGKQPLRRGDEPRWPVGAARSTTATGRDVGRQRGYALEPRGTVTM
jgi:hypothetical protein